MAKNLCIIYTYEPMSTLIDSFVSVKKQFPTAKVGHFIEQHERVKSSDRDDIPRIMSTNRTICLCSEEIVEFLKKNPPDSIPDFGIDKFNISMKIDNLKKIDRIDLKTLFISVPSVLSAGEAKKILSDRLEYFRKEWGFFGEKSSPKITVLMKSRRGTGIHAGKAFINFSETDPTDDIVATMILLNDSDWVSNPDETESDDRIYCRFRKDQIREDEESPSPSGEAAGSSKGHETWRVSRRRQKKEKKSDDSKE